MSRAPSRGGRQEHPHGHLETVEDRWKDDVRAELKRRGWFQKDLAREIDASEGTITNMMKPGATQLRSVFKQRIHKVFGWADSAKLAEVYRRVERKWLSLSVEDAERIAGLIDALAKR